MATGTVTVNGKNDDFKMMTNGSSTPQPLGFTLGVGQTLTKLEFGLASGTKMWYNPNNNTTNKDLTFTLYVCNSSGGSETQIGTVLIRGYGISWGNASTTTFTFSATSLRGQAVYIKATGPAGLNFSLRGGSGNPAPVTVTYTYDTSSHPTVSAGDTITAAKMGDLYFYKYGTNNNPGQGNVIQPWIFGSAGNQLKASDYNGA